MGSGVSGRFNGKPLELTHEPKVYVLLRSPLGHGGRQFFLHSNGYTKDSYPSLNLTEFQMRRYMYDRAECTLYGPQAQDPPDGEPPCQSLSECDASKPNVWNG